MQVGIRIAAFMAIILTFPAFLQPGMAQEQGAADWLATAIVSADHIYLADLLATGVNAQLREAAARIDLGRAPEPGSFRVFTENQLQEATGWDFALDLPERVTVRRRGWPILSEQVTAALMDAKLPTVPVTLLGAPEARRVHAILHVSAILPNHNPNVVLVRFECRDRSECAPFWGEVGVAKDWQQSLPAQNLAHRATHPPALVEPGRSAMLICDEPGMEVRLRVRPLGRAGIGETVRVYDPDTRRVFAAWVKGEDLVTSDLQEAR